MENFSRFGRKLLQNAVIYQMKQPSGFRNSTRQFFYSASLLGRGVLKEGENPRKISREDWLKRLTPEQFHICREKGTEMPFTGALTNNEDAGIYSCVCCGEPLFSSETKFESGSGWPSFYDAVTPENAKKSNVKSKKDVSHGMYRTEVMCRACDSHLGHVFSDGPKPTGLRYCINSEALRFEPDTS